MKKAFLLLIIGLSLSGCATVNFSANYYTPPKDYQAEVRNTWNELLAKCALKNQYNLSIVTDRECSTPGIPQISNYNVKIPETFIKYIYQNYYDSRSIILSSVIAHEACHAEYNLHDQSTPKAHFQTDQKAIELLKDKNVCSAQDYYKSLLVLRNYWFARKGMGGHAFNLGWNVAQLASLAYLGSANFMDWYATDLNKRLALISREYKIRSGKCFKRTECVKTGTAPYLKTSMYKKLSKLTLALGR